MIEVRKTLVISIIVLTLIYIYAKLLGPFPFSVNSVQTMKDSPFSVTGTGEATAVPDTARVSIGVTQSGKTVEETQSKTNSAVEKVINEIKKVGIDEKDIKTTNYSVNPRYDFGLSSSRQEIIGYEVTQNLEINVEDNSKINKVIDTATANGANQVGGVQFVFTDEKRSELENSAREEAVKNAKKKAEGLAKASGLKLGKIIDVSESFNGETPRPLMAKELGGAAPDSVANTNITPGENRVEVTVTLFFETL